MSNQGNPSGSRWFFIMLVLLAGSFVGLAGVRYWLNHRDAQDQQRLAELSQAQLAHALPKDTSATDWPQWRGPNRDGVSLETGILTDWPETDALQTLKVWEADVGPSYATMAVADGRVYTIFQEGKDEAVVCWDAETGTELWRFRYDADLARHGYEYGPSPRSTPTVEGDRVYTVGGTGIMHCLKTHPESTEGAVIWKKHLLDEFGARNLKWGVAFSPLIVGDLVYTMPGGRDGKSVAALDKNSGDTVWHNLDDQAGYSSPVWATIAGKEQVLFFTAVGLAALTPDTGEVLWQFPWSTHWDVNAAMPIVAGDYVFISSGYGTGCAVIHIEPDSDGNLHPHQVYRKRREMKNHFSSSVLYKDHLYGFSDTVLTCMNFRTGEVPWTFRDRHAFGKGSLLIADGHLILLGDRGLLAIAEATPDEIEIKASLQLPNKSNTDRCWSMPVLSGGLLYVRDQEKIYCLNLRKISPPK